MKFVILGALVFLSFISTAAKAYEPPATLPAVIDVIRFGQTGVPQEKHFRITDETRRRMVMDWIASSEHEAIVSNIADLKDPMTGQIALYEKPGDTKPSQTVELYETNRHVLGRGCGDWKFKELYSLAAIPDEPVQSKPVEKNGLSITLLLPSATFQTGEPVHFWARFKNVSNQPMSLFEVSELIHWEINFKDQQRDGTWQWRTRPEQQHAKGKGGIWPIEPDRAEFVEVSIDPDDKQNQLEWNGPSRALTALPKSLPGGKYELAVGIKLDRPTEMDQATFPFWTGTISSRPVAFQVKDAAAAAAKADNKQ